MHDNREGLVNNELALGNHSAFKFLNIRKVLACQVSNLLGTQPTPNVSLDVFGARAMLPGGGFWGLAQSGRKTVADRNVVALALSGNQDELTVFGAHYAQRRHVLAQPFALLSP